MHCRRLSMPGRATLVLQSRADSVLSACRWPRNSRHDRRREPLTDGCGGDIPGKRVEICLRSALSFDSCDSSHGAGCQPVSIHGLPAVLRSKDGNVFHRTFRPCGGSLGIHAAPERSCTGKQRRRCFHRWACSVMESDDGTSNSFHACWLLCAARQSVVGRQHCEGQCCNTRQLS